ncbi:MAG: hypothetical protein A3G93_01345 [Nitrospinae bacterium RIFCSPLOWO2_12_FULL_45_22]|nr:MAG: hypothetical protein A3G93_01345 [Nitrospinae bacterium RIFCSPLOWO2_12_FULL_45_22]
MNKVNCKVSIALNTCPRRYKVACISIPLILYFIIGVAAPNDIAKAGNNLERAEIYTSTGKNISFIKIQNDLLTVRLKDTPLQKVLKEIARQSGLKILLYIPIEDKVSLEFYALPLERGLHRILCDKNHIFLYFKTKSEPGKFSPIRLREVRVYPNGYWIAGNEHEGEKEQLHQLKRRLLEDPDANVRESAAEALGKSGDPRAMDLLLQALMDENPNIRIRALFALSELVGPIPLEPIKDIALHDGEPEVKIYAIEALRDIGKNESIEIFKLALNDMNRGVRLAVIEALGDIGGAEALNVLKLASYDDDVNVRIMAAELVKTMEMEDEYPAD